MLLSVIGSCAVVFHASAVAPTLEVKLEGDAPAVACSVDGETLLKSPPEGLWSIAMDWRDGWPSAWYHAAPDTLEQAGEWTILRGLVETAQGNWRVSDAYRPRGEVIQCVRRFVWEGEAVAAKSTLSVRFQTPGTGDAIMMPGNIYYGNPSGAKSGRVPVYRGASGDEAIFEEHRYPMPYVSLEWAGEASRWAGALHTLPSPVPYGNLPDQWWSLGARALDHGTELLLLSGPCSVNGKRSAVKVTQRSFLPYDNAYLDVPPGAIIEKTFYLQACAVAREGAGFQAPTRTSVKLFAPGVSRDLPGFAEIIDAKYRYAKTRWFEKDGAAGFRKYPDKDIIVLGWCGQAAAPGYALQVLSPHLDGPEALSMAQRSLDFISNAAFYEGGFHTWYHADSGTWDRHEPLSQGQAMLNVAQAIHASERSGLDPAKWKAFLVEACRFHAKRILDDAWKPVSTDEAFFIAPLCEGYRIFGEARFKEAAEKAGRVYAERSVDMTEPYWGGTLDASCEDKEGAFAAAQGFLALYELTEEPEYLRWAEHATDVMLTYVVVWDIDLPPGRLRDHAFKTRGWTAVSAQNQHIDVYGVLMAPCIYRMGELTGREDLQDLALLMFRTCGQLIDPYGSQGEQPQHTNFEQARPTDTAFGHRGGYVEDWTVFWITAHFLNAAAQFEELGVPIWE